MADEIPTPGELGRMIAALRDTQRDGFAAINARLDRLVTNELYAAEQRRVDDRIQALMDALAAEREARIRTIKDEAATREKEITEVEGAVEKFKTSLRWLAASILVPVGLFVFNLVEGV